MPEVAHQCIFVPSCLSSNTGEWQTAAEYKKSELSVSSLGFSSATNVLLTQPNLNSSYLFRADILYDSAKYLKTTLEHERDRGISTAAEVYDEDVVRRTPETFTGFTLTRTVVRELIPRNSQLDESLRQTCHIYEAGASGNLVVYGSHADSAETTAWYHPPVKALAYLYEIQTPSDEAHFHASISIHVLPFESSPTGKPIPTRLHRTLLSLLHTLTRLAKAMSLQPEERINAAIAPKDNIIPQHIVQNTYSRLKRTYSADLISRWVEKTEPSKHLFEDLSIAAFLIELWRQMYGVFPHCERSALVASGPFPGFIDLACGNGVLVYILRKEGYEGWGFDARRRRTWEIFPGDVQHHLLERVLVPKPYLDVSIRPTGPENSNTRHQEQMQRSLSGLEYHNGIFKAGTFIISNHADELTPWTPVLATLSCPRDPLPWLAIPCCSHALSGARYRYPVPIPAPKSEKHVSNNTFLGARALDSTVDFMVRSDDSMNNEWQSPKSPDNQIKCREDEGQPANGDLKALRAAKAKAASGADRNSMYACLTAKVIALAEELGITTERTLMRIPSTRNIGIIGGRRRATPNPALKVEMCNNEDKGEDEDLTSGGGEMDLNHHTLTLELGESVGFNNAQNEDGASVKPGDAVSRRVAELVERECRASGGVAAAARLWIERTKSLQSGQGRGKVNGGKTHG